MAENHLDGLPTVESSDSDLQNFDFELRSSTLATAVGEHSCSCSQRGRGLFRRMGQSLFKKLTKHNCSQLKALRLSYVGQEASDKIRQASLDPVEHTIG